MNRSNHLFKNTIIIGVGTICTKLLSFIMIPFYTLWLSPIEFGNYDLLLTYITLIVPIVTLQLEQAVFRFSLKNKLESKRYFQHALLFIVLNIVIVDILALVVLNGVAFCFPFIFYFDTFAIFLLCSEYLRGKNKLKEYSFFNIISSTFIVIFNFIFVPFLNLGATGLLLSFAFSYLIVDIFVIFKNKLYKGIISDGFDFKLLKQMIGFSFPMIPNGIAWWITNVSDRTMIKVILGEFSNGIYAISCKIPTILSLIFGIFNLSWQQSAILSSSDQDREVFYKSIFDQLIFFLFGFGFIILTLLPFVFRFLLSSNYSDGISYIPLMLLAVIFLSLAQFLGGVFLADSKTKILGITTTVSAIINIAINFILMKQFGLIIATLSTLVSYLYLFFSRYYKLKSMWNWRSLAVIFSLSGVFILFSEIILNSNNIFFLSFLFIGSVLLFIIINFPFLKNILLQFRNRRKTN